MIAVNNVSMALNMESMVRTLRLEHPTVPASQCLFAEARCQDPLHRSGRNGYLAEDSVHLNNYLDLIRISSYQKQGPSTFEKPIVSIGKSTKQR